MDSSDKHYFVTSAFSLVTGFALYKLISSQWNVHDHNKKISMIQKTKIKSVEDPIQLNETVIVKGQIGFNDKDLRNEVIQKTEKSGKIDQYLVHIRYIQGMYSNDGFKSKDDYKINLKETVSKSDIIFNPSFCIKGRERQLIVYDWDRIDYSPLLEITKWETNKRKLSFTEKIQTLILTYFRSIGTLVISDKSRPSFIRGLEIGTREVETGIKMGSSVMALGTIGMTAEGIVFLEPHVFFRDRLSIITDLKELLKSYEESRNFWAVVFIIGAVYVGRRAFKYNKTHQVWNRFKQDYLGIKPVKN